MTATATKTRRSARPRRRAARPKVLIGVDGSEFAREAARHATALIPKDADVTVATVVQHTIGAHAVNMGEPLLGMSNTLDFEDAIAAQLDEARTEARAVARALHSKAHATAAVGDPGVELCRIAEETDCDLLVVGSHGSGFLKRVMLGSVSDYVMHHAPCPVLVMRRPEDDESAAD